jgi:uncharacterized membrane protein YphA (DoxX/SURF4 family)
MEFVSLLGHTAAIFTAWLFAVAGWHKVRHANRDYYAEVFAGYGIPERFNGILPKLVGAVEIFIAIGVLLPASRSPACSVAAAVLLFYLALMAGQLKAGRRVECGCSGSTGVAISGHLLVRNAIFAGIALLGLLPAAGNGLGVWSIAVVTAGVCALISASCQQLINNSQKLQYR